MELVKRLRQKWEYKVTQIKVVELEEKLNALGDNDWELVRAEKGDAHGIYYTCILKRPN